jgi:hypothetical protein
MIGNAVTFDVLVNLHLVVAVVAERVKDLRQLEVRQMVRDFLGRGSQPPKLDNGANSGFGTLDYGLAIQQALIGYDVRMCHKSRHTFFPLQYCNIPLVA